MSKRKVLTDVLVSGAVRVAIRLRGLVFIPLISIELGIAAFGAYAQVLAITTLLELCFGLGLYAGLVRYGRRTERLAPLYYALLLVVTASSALGAVAVVLAAPQIARLTLGNVQYAGALRAGAFLVVTRSLVRLARNYFRIDSRVKLFSVLEGLRAYGLIAVVALSVLVFDTGLAGLFAAMVGLEALVFLAVQGQIAREIGLAVPAVDDLWRYLEYSVPVALSSLAESSTSRLDRILVGVFLGASAVGVYSITYQIAIAIKMYVSPIRQTFFPEFSAFVDQGEYRKCGSYLTTGLRYFLIIALPTVGGMYLIGPDVIGLLTDGQGIPSPALIGVIAFGLLWNGVDQQYGVAMRALEATRERAAILSLGVGANVLINAALLPLLGIMGAAIGTLATYVLVAGLTMNRVRSSIPARFPWRTGLRCSGATAAMVAVATVALDGALVSTVAVSVVVYLCLLFVLRELTVAEFRGHIPS